jgi:GMP synthase-like glutamine amidotransferase
MAQAFGGAAIKSPKGWGVVLHRYDVATPAPWMDAVPHIDAPASHQDQVVAPPPDARVTLRSGFTPYAGLDYGDAISFQFHPEFTPAFSAALIGALRNRYEPRQAETAIASHQQPSDAPRVGRWISRFLDRPTPI